MMKNLALTEASIVSPGPSTRAPAAAIDGRARASQVEIAESRNAAHE
jgi:hypothetical protein